MVRRELSNGSFEQVDLSELEQVRVMTTDDGPYAEDVFFVLIGAAQTGCVVPQGAMPDQLLERLQQLPGFDNAALIQAMSSTDNAEFICWPPNAAEASSG